MRKTILVCCFEGCKATFLRADRYEIHKNQHLNLRPFVCLYDNCDKSYTSAQHLKRHEEVHKGTYKCPGENCDFLFKTKSTLQKHINIVHSKTKLKTYKCSRCKEQFNCQSWLKRHEYRHTGVKPYECTYDGCGKRFLTPSKLKRHSKVHDGYPCTIPGCNEIIPKWNLVLKHVQEAHPPVHRCDVCKKQLSSFANLKSHLTTHYLEDREVFECPKPHCSRFYFRKNNLTAHIKSYHEKRSFICKQENCYREFKTEADLDRHLLRNHRSSLPPRKKKKILKNIKKEKKQSRSGKLAGCSPSKKSQKKSRVHIKAEEENQTGPNQKNITTHEELSVIVKSQSKDNNTKNNVGTDREVEYVPFEEFIRV